MISWQIPQVDVGSGLRPQPNDSALQTIKVRAACADLYDEFVELYRAGITALSIGHRLATDTHRLVAISFDLDRGFSPKLRDKQNGNHQEICVHLRLE